MKSQNLLSEEKKKKLVFAELFFYRACRAFKVNGQVLLRIFFCYNVKADSLTYHPNTKFHMKETRGP